MGERDPFFVSSSLPPKSIITTAPYHQKYRFNQPIFENAMEKVEISLKLFYNVLGLSFDASRGCKL